MEASPQLSLWTAKINSSYTQQTLQIASYDMPVSGVQVLVTAYESLRLYSFSSLLLD